jgi:hypothetical protein
MFYDALIERDYEAARAAIHEYRNEHNSHDLFLAVTRFAVLAYAPSQHAKHALLACLAAYDLREELGPRYDDVLTECALYAASSRQPWSEPPILDPPPLEDDQRGDLGEIRAAMAEGDRLRAERWLAKRHADSDFAADFFTAAADDFEDLGHKLIVAQAAWKLAGVLGEKGWFAALRVAVWEWTAYRGRRFDEVGVALDPRSLAARLCDNFVCEKGSIVAAHALFLLDAALEVEPPVATRVRDYLTNYTNEMPCLDEVGDAPAEVPVYRLARDCGELLKSFAVAKRLRVRFPDLDVSRITAAARYNLEHGTSFEEFSFA